MAMDTKAAEARRAYKRAWNRKNRDKVRAAQERYWKRKFETMQAADHVPAEDPETVNN